MSTRQLLERIIHDQRLMNCRRMCCRLLTLLVLLQTLQSRHVAAGGLVMLLRCLNLSLLRGTTLHSEAAVYQPLPELLNPAFCLWNVKNCLVHPYNATILKNLCTNNFIYIYKQTETYKIFFCYTKVRREKLVRCKWSDQPRDKHPAKSLT